jgi:hypothetical protein
MVAAGRSNGRTARKARPLKKLRRSANEGDAAQTGRNAVEFLARHFTLWDLDFQIWMPIVVGAFFIYLAYLWKTDQT